MESKIEDFNWNLRIFLDVLSAYQANVNKANPTTLDLLEKTLDSISDLIGNVEEVSAGQGDAIMCSFDENQFEVKRTIFCRICKVDIDASRIQYLLHLADPKHNANLIETCKKDVSTQNNGFDRNNNSKSAPAVDSSAKKNGTVIQRPNLPSKSVQNTKEADTKKSNGYIGDMAGLIASLKKSHVSKVDNGNRNIGPAKDAENIIPAKASVPNPIPNVFDDNIYEFIESIGKQEKYGDLTKVNEPLLSNASQNLNVPQAVSKSIFEMLGSYQDPYSTKGLAREPENSGLGASNWRQELRSWRGEPKVSVPPNKIEQWRAKNASDTLKPSTSAMNTTLVAPKPMSAAPKPATEAKAMPTPMTQSIIQKGAVLTGAGVKPCATYDLNNLYIKFPHLNPNKVENPLKPDPLKDVRNPEAANKTSVVADSKLKNFFDKVNKGKKAPQQLGTSPLQKTEMTNSLLSLTTLNNKNANATTGQQPHRMPPRSASSFNLTGISRIEGSNPQKGGRKSSPQINGQINNNKNQIGNTNNRNENNKTQNSNGKGPSTPNDARSKGAIPKQPAKNTPQVAKQMTYNEASKLNKDSQGKDKNESARASENIKESEEMAAVVNKEQLQKFFSGDLSALISLMVNLNLRREKAETQQKIIKSVESALKSKFQTMKCHLMGSHVYNIAKGGLATLDVYLDLHNSFHADKSGQTFVNGMNDTMKLLSINNEWSDAECSEQTRYGILSVTHKATNLKCNFTFGTGVGVRNTEVVNSLFEAQPVARQMAICVRLALQDGASVGWAKNFSGYVVALLVIFYLQTVNKLPSVLALQNNATSGAIKCGENVVHFEKPKNIQICKDRLRDLLIGFFDYYEKFDYFNKIISPFEGRDINQNFRNYVPDDSLSRSMRRFKNLIETEPHRWTNNKMCIQDIFEHKRNVGQAIQSKDVKAFADFCGKALFAIRAAGNSVKY